MNMRHTNIQWCTNMIMKLTHTVTYKYHTHIQWCTDMTMKWTNIQWYTNMSDVRIGVWDIQICSDVQIWYIVYLALLHGPIPVQRVMGLPTQNRNRNSRREDRETDTKAWRHRDADFAQGRQRDRHRDIETQRHRLCETWRHRLCAETDTET